MCGERVRRCRAACRAQGGAGYLLDPEGPAAGPARAHGGIPPFAALLTFPSGADGERPDREGTRVFRGIGLRTVQLSSRY
jgi:hypothetical protein